MNPVSAALQRAENFRAYEAACKRGEVVPGRMFVVATALLEGTRLVISRSGRSTRE